MRLAYTAKRTNAARVTWFVISELFRTVRITGVAIVEAPTPVPTICAPRGVAATNPYPLSLSLSLSICHFHCNNKLFKICKVGEGFSIQELYNIKENFVIVT
jgi:hypothetical protein